jgi:transposase
MKKHNNQLKSIKESKIMEKRQGRVIGLDVHPDSFAGAIVEGRDPGRARVVSTSTRVELKQLEKWALGQSGSEDTLVLEASGNAFAVAARLRAIGRQVEILDSHRAGKVGKVYCANDRVDAVKIARIYLSALSPVVWQPDEKTLERREVFSAYQGVVKESTRARQQLRAMLNEHCVRLEKGFRLCHPKAIERLLRLAKWTPARRMLLEQLHGTLVAARGRRTRLRRHMASEIVAEADFLKLTRLCGISLITLYGLVSAVGDVRRFTHSKKLVAYLGLNPSVSQSGNFEGGGALKRHGRGALRALLIQSGKRLLEVNNPLQKWGLAVAARRGRNKAAVAVARKLCVAVWHLLMGHVIGSLERLDTLQTKLSKFATEIGPTALAAFGFDNKADFVKKQLYVLQSYP